MTGILASAAVGVVAAPAPEASAKPMGCNILYTRINNAWNSYLGSTGAARGVALQRYSYELRRAESWGCL